MNLTSEGPILFIVQAAKGAGHQRHPRPLPTQPYSVAQAASGAYQHTTKVDVGTERRGKYTVVF